MYSLDQTLQQAAAQGQSFFAASGDFGAFDCAGGQPPTNQLSVDSPANDPLITAVGGTALSLNANFTYLSESAWTTSGVTPPHGTGGGLSNFFPRPAWQTGPGVANVYSTFVRQVPDVALDADPATGYSFCVTTCATSPPGQGWRVLGGTSAAAPSWAAFTALYNQYAAGVSRPRLGFANPMLYNLGSNPQTSPPYHDVTTGNNLYYNATIGWDYPTGWGTPQVSNLVVDITQNPAAPRWVRQATAAAAGGAPAAPLLQWFGAPATAGGTPVPPSRPWYPRPSVASAGQAPATPTLPRQAGGGPSAASAVYVRGWAAQFMPEVMQRLSRWLSSP
jgi:subtilase family serine protease